MLRANFSESAPRPIDQVIWEMSGRNPGRVSREQALTVPAMVKGRNLICSISTLPLVQLNARNERVRLPLLEQIDPDVPNVVTLAQTLEDLLFEGISWWLVIATDGQGYPTYARHVDVSSVSLDPPPDARTPAPLPGGYDPRAASVWIDGVQVPASSVIRFDSPNPAVLKSGARAIRRAILLDKAAAMYADDPRPLDYFTPAEGAEEIDDDEVKDILAEWKAARKKRSTAWVPASMKYNSVDAPSPQQLQLVELQQRAALDVANMVGVDPEDLGVSTTSRTYANAIDRRRDKINDVLSPYMRAVTDRLSMGDVTRRGYRTVFVLADYLKSNPTERWSVYKIQHELGAITLDEIREEDERPPLPPGARPAPPPPPAVPGDETEESEVDERTVDASRAAMFAELRKSGLRLSDDEASLQFADLPVTEFSVDRKTRTITGLALPYGKIGTKYGLAFRFDRGALVWSDPTRVKLNKHHDVRETVGYAAEIKDTPAGLRMRFKVARGAAGDDALQLAEDKVLDGLSVGVNFDAAADTAPDPQNQGVLLVRRADLRHVALTPEPVFDDARVSEVHASRTEGTTVEECATCGQRHAPGVACPTAPQQNDSQPQGGLTLTNEQLTALLARPGALDAIAQASRPQPAQPTQPTGALTLSAEQVDTLIRSGGLGVLLGVPHLGPAPQPAAEPEQRQVVDPTRRTATTSVRESLPYRFDRRGNLMRGPQYDFSTDLINGLKGGDGESYNRALRFVQVQFSGAVESTATPAEFAVDTTGVAALNPPRQRPDLFVDQLDYKTPLWDFVNRGTLDSSTPFIVPKFASSAGLVGNHTQNTEPTPGSYTATTQTITPGPLSGKVEVTREAWDAGGNPQLSSLLWQQMTREWFEDLEAATATFLNTLTAAADIAIPTGAQDDVLDAAWSSAMADLQFVRGGHRFEAFAAHIDLYKAFAGAVDASGRRLYPIIGAQNATGTAAPRWGTLDLGGVTGAPSWALGATSTNSSNSWLFNPQDVHGWASAPQRLQFEYQVKTVEVGIWGYLAHANTRIDGVRQVTYDPTV